MSFANINVGIIESSMIKRFPRKIMPRNIERIRGMGDPTSPRFRNLTLNLRPTPKKLGDLDHKEFISGIPKVSLWSRSYQTVSVVMQRGSPSCRRISNWT